MTKESANSYKYAVRTSKESIESQLLKYKLLIEHKSLIDSIDGDLLHLYYTSVYNKIVTLDFHFNPGTDQEKVEDLVIVLAESYEFALIESVSPAQKPTLVWMSYKPVLFDGIPVEFRFTLGYTIPDTYKLEYEPPYQEYMPSGGYYKATCRRS